MIFLNNSFINNHIKSRYFVVEVKVLSWFLQILPGTLGPRGDIITFKADESVFYVSPCLTTFLRMSLDLEKFFGRSVGSAKVGENTSAINSTPSDRLKLLSNIGALSFFSSFQILSISKNRRPFVYGLCSSKRLL